MNFVQLQIFQFLANLHNIHLLHKLLNYTSSPSKRPISNQIFTYFCRHKIHLLATCINKSWYNNCFSNYTNMHLIPGKRKTSMSLFSIFLKYFKWNLAIKNIRKEVKGFVWLTVQRGRQSRNHRCLHSDFLWSEQRWEARIWSDTDRLSVCEDGIIIMHLSIYTDSQIMTRRPMFL